MKKLFSILMIFAFVFTAAPPTQAQIVKKITTIKDSVVNADFTTISLPADNTVRSFEVMATKVSGTVAGQATFQGLAHDGINWVGIDSISLVDQPVNFKVFIPLAQLPYQSYRVKVNTTGTSKLKPIVAYTLRRTSPVTYP